MDAAGSQRKRILVCEDDTLVASSIIDSLTGAGYEVVGPVSSAEEALSLVARDQPAVALVDIALKGTLDGVELAQRLSPMGIQVVYLTANEARAEAGRAHAVDALIKPIRLASFLSVIGKAAARWQGRVGSVTYVDFAR